MPKKMPKKSADFGKEGMITSRGEDKKLMYKMKKQNSISILLPSQANQPS